MYTTKYNNYHRDKLKLNDYIESQHKFKNIKPQDTVTKNFPTYILKSGLKTNIINTSLIDIPEIIVLNNDCELVQDDINIASFLITDNCNKITINPTINITTVLQFINTTHYDIQCTYQEKQWYIYSNSIKYIYI